MFGDIFQTLSNGAVSYVVTSDDGETLYISNIFSQAMPSGYVKATLRDSKVEMEFPQVVEYGYDSAGNPVPFYAAVLEYDAEGSTFVVSDNQTYTFNIDDAGVMTPANPDAMIGWVVYFAPEGMEEDYYWQGVGDIFESFSPFTQQPLAAPDDVEFADWALVYNGEASPVKVGIKDDTVYIKDFLGYNFEGLNDATIMGTIADGKVSFADNQYLGIDQWLMSTIYFRGGEPVFNEEWGIVESFEGGAFIADFSENLIKGENCYFLTRVADDVNFEAFVENPFFAKADPNAPAASPAAPINLRYDDGTADNPDDPTPYLDFSIPTYDINYNPIDYWNLYWQLIVDGEPYTFEPEVYGVEEPMNTVPFDYTSDEWTILTMDAQHFVDIKFTGFTSLGVRSVYIDGDTELYSETSWVSGYSSVEDNVAVSEIVAKEYYDLSGRRVSNPGQGLYIERRHHADGSVSAVKAIR